jgi:hypothetical protein
MVRREFDANRARFGFDPAIRDGISDNAGSRRCAMSKTFMAGS